MQNLEGHVAIPEEAVEPEGRRMVRLFYITTPDIAEEVSRKFAAIEEFRELSGRDVSPEDIEWIEIEIVKGRE